MGFKEELNEYVRNFKESGETLYRWRKGYGHPFELDLLDVEELIAFLDKIGKLQEQNTRFREALMTIGKYGYRDMARVAMEALRDKKDEQ